MSDNEYATYSKTNRQLTISMSHFETSAIYTLLWFINFIFIQWNINISECMMRMSTDETDKCICLF
jgi:hypothetical protein